jgi:hypothetical protein
MTNQVQFIPDNNNSEVAHLMNVLVKELRGHVIERPICMEEAAEFLQVTSKTIRKYIRTGAIPIRLIHHIGGRPYFFPSELRDLVKRS